MKNFLLKIWIIFFWVASYIVNTQAFFEIVEVFPNTIDDTNLEYIILKNISDESKSLSGYTLADKKKEYLMTEDILLKSKEERKFLRTETKIILNNSNEELRIISPEWEIIHEIEYKSSVKWAFLSFWTLDDEDWEEEKIISEEISLKIIISDEAKLENSEKIEQIEEKLEAPEVVFSLQRPSYIWEIEDENIFLCEDARDACKVNFDLRNSFWEDFSEWDYMCQIDFWFSGFESQEERCNPNTVVFPVWEHTVVFRISHEDNADIFSEKAIKIINTPKAILDNIQEEDEVKSVEEEEQEIIVGDAGMRPEEEVVENPDLRSLLTVPNIILWLQIPSYIEYSQEKDSYICDSERDECKVNFDLRNSFWEEYSEWDYICNIDFGISGFEPQEERCNPNTVIFPKWEYEIIFRISHEDNADIFSEKAIKVLNIPEVLAENIQEKEEEQEKIVGDAGMRPEWAENSEVYFEKDLEELNVQELFEIPEVILGLQIPSYIEYSEEENVYVCDSERDDCKINFDLRDSFSENYPERDYVCEIDFWFWEITEQEKRCNPNTVIFPEGEHSVTFRIFHEDNEEIFSQKVIQVNNVAQSNSILANQDSSQSSQTSSIEPEVKMAKIHISTPSIIVQSGLEWSGRYFYCKKEECKINLNYEKQHKNERCFWDFWEWVASSSSTHTRCNPGYVTYWRWVFELSLKVYEKNNEVHFKKYDFYVYNNRVTLWEEEILVENNKQEDIKILDNIEWGYSEDIKIVPQWKIWKEKKVIDENSLECWWVEKCFVNLNGEISWDTKWLSYIWKVNNEVFSEKQNPPGIWIEQWESVISLEVFLNWEKISEKLYFVLVSSSKNIEKINNPEKNNENIWKEDLWDKEDTLWEKQISKSALKKIFTQNFLVLKYDWLRISGKAPIWSKIEIYLNWEKILEWSWDEKWKYKILTKNLKAWEYTFDTKIIYKSWEELYVKNSWEFEILEEKIENWISKEEAEAKQKNKALKKIFTQNFLVLKYDWLRISGKAPTHAKVEIFLNWKKFLSGVGDEKWKYRLVTKNLKAGKYAFDTKIIYLNGEVLYIKNSWEFEILNSKIWNWFTVKKKKTSSKSQSSFKFPKLIFEANAYSDFDSNSPEELSIFRKIIFIWGLCFLMLLALISIILKNISPVNLFILESQRLSFWVRQKVCLLV